MLNTTCDDPAQILGTQRNAVGQVSSDTEKPRSRGRWLAMWVAPALTILVAIGVGFHPLVLRPGDVLVGPQHFGNNDLTAYFLASRAFARQTAQRFGQPPLWNPYLLAGTPHVGNPQSAWLYPPNWIYEIVDSEAASSWVMVLHHAWAALGVYFLCRRWRVGQFAACAGASVMACAPYW